MGNTKKEKEKTISIKKESTVLANKKKILHNLIDSLTEADYVSFTTSLENLTAETQKLYKIIIEINGNIHVIRKKEED